MEFSNNSESMEQFKREVEADLEDALEHGIIVSVLARKLAKELGKDEEFCEDIALAGLLHDIGKMKLSRYLHWRADDAFKVEEMKYVRLHSRYSYEILKDGDYSKDVLEAIHYHHENYDGSGYPEKLEGTNIPEGARMLRVCDVYAALISDRPYRSAFDMKTAMELMIEEVKYFDMKIFLAFQRMINSIDIEHILCDNILVKHSELDGCIKIYINREKERKDCKKMITQRPKGTQDWYGEDMYKRTVIEKKARNLCEKYNIKEIITPIFEHTVLFQRGVGETTDVVQKEMYTFEDKGNRSITLKPEGTAGAIRAYLENNIYAQSQPSKLFYVTPAFRYEKPQKGRLRQHHQFGIEFIGSKSPLAEVELITLLTKFLEEIGLKDAKLHINSIGCKNCRKTYNQALLEYLKQHEDGLCPTCRERMLKNPLRVIDCKDPSCKEIVKNAPRTIEYLDDECKEHFEELQELLKALDIPYEIDTGIVRGLDYYTKTVFEFVNSDGFTLCGGGRYDGLIHEIDEKQDIPSVGFGMGIERILYFIEKEGVELEPEKKVELYVGILGKEARVEAYKIVKKLRENGVIVETDYMDRSLKAQMKYANKIGAKNTVILGENEISQGVANIKNMDTHEQTEVKLDEIEKYFI